MNQLNSDKKIGFVGLSHLGIVSSLAATSKGFDVTAYDPRENICQELNQQHLPVSEPYLPELFKDNHNKIRFTSNPNDLAPIDTIYFSIDITTDENNRSDLSGLHRLIDEVVPYAKPGATLIILSQVPPGFTRQLSDRLGPVLSDRRLNLFYQVETLIFGRAVERATQPERLIVGCANPKAPLPSTYGQFLNSFQCPVLPMRYESAELCKISINAFLAASLSSTNTLAEICEGLGADWAEIVPALKLDRRIGPYAYLQPGLGIAGGNIERDLVAIKNMAADVGADDRVAEAFLSNSQYRRHWVIKTLQQYLLSQQNQTIAIWGLAYKPDTHSVKNSPTLTLLDSLHGISVQLYDPKAILTGDYPNTLQVSSALEACRGADVLVIMTAWKEFTSISSSAVREVLKRKIIVDPMAIWGERNLESEGFVYITLGKK